MSDKKKAKKGHPFDAFHKEKVCKIPFTGKKYVDPMKELRPEKGKKNDYILEQTYAIIDRGNVKLRYTDTTGEYNLAKDNNAIQTRIRKRAQRGRGPLDMLLDELWNEVVEVHQKFLGLHMRSMIAKRKNLEDEVYKYYNRKFAILLGPDWYQELSNRQKATVDNLASCIVKDLRGGTDQNTLTNLAELGLVLRPNRKAVKIALKNCCASPVEFLLTLYEISHPKRKFYSLNDRLLLSAVTHLSMENTLKELHIRIPSPPRASKPEPMPLPKKRSSKKVEKSPYLCTYIYNPKPKPPPCKPEKVYPKIEYVSYWKDLKERSRLLVSPGGFASSISRKNSDSLECIKARDWEVAQRYYNKLHAGRDLQALEQVTIYPTCVTRLNQLIKKSRSAKYKTTDFVAEDLKITKPEVVEGMGISQAALFEQIKSFEAKLKQMEIDEGEVEEEEGVSVAELVYDEESCKLCSLQGSCVTPPMGCDCQPEEEKQSTQEPCKGACNAVDWDYVCTCPKEIDEDEFEMRRILLEAHDELREHKFVITNTSTGADGKPIYTVAGVFKDTDQRVKRKTSRGVLKVAPRPSMGCICKQRILDRAANQCFCDRCVQDRERANIKGTLIIEGTQEKSGKSTKIVSGVKAEKICTCLEKFEAKCRRHEKRQAILKMQEDLRSLKTQFIITGTSVGSDGKPVYTLGGVKEDARCSCFDKEMLEEEERKAQEVAAVPPGGCLKYAISGVQARPDGNVYIISGVTPNTDCNCMELFYRYLEPHNYCLKAFDAFLEKLAFEIDMYFDELDPFYEDFDPEEEEPYCECESVIDEDEEKLSSPEQSSGARTSKSSFFSRAQTSSPDNTIAKTERAHHADAESIPICPRSLEEESICTESMEEEEAEEASVEEEATVKEAPRKESRKKSIGNLVGRYFILEEIPRKRSLQIEILRTALKMLADDGFPLARLPEAHRLPHFKVWFQMRTRKALTQEMRDKLRLKSLTLWSRVDSRREKVWPPNVSFLRTIHDKHNWKYNALIRHANGVFKDLYLRQVKATCMNYGRNLFPTMFPYQQPWKGFRDTFFAYMPSKMEDVHPVRVWKPIEVRRQANPLLRRLGEGIR